MSSSNKSPVEELDEKSQKHWGLAAIAASGLILILLALTLPAKPALNLPRDLLRELGIAVLAVFTVSWIYEIGLAKRHMEKFTAQLRDEVMKGQGAASTCAVIGIDEIFRERVAYEQQYGIYSQLHDTEGELHVRLVARSAYTVVGHAAERFAEVIERGAHVEICVLDPRLNDDELAWNIDVARPDVIVTLKLLRTMLTDRLTNAKGEQRASGQLLISLHRVPMLDSFLSVSAATKHWCTWDLSFGRDTSRKTVLMLDTKKALGKNVINRYNHVCKRAERIFVFADRQIEIDLLTTVIDEADGIESKNRGHGAA